MPALGWVFLSLGPLGVVLLVATGSGGVGLVPALLAVLPVVGWGLVTRRSWAYPAATVFALVGAVTSIVWMLLGVAIAAAGLVVSAGILFTLWSPLGRAARRSDGGS